MTELMENRKEKLPTGINSYAGILWEKLGRSKMIKIAELFKRNHPLVFDPDLARTTLQCNLDRDERGVSVLVENGDEINGAIIGIEKEDDPKTLFIGGTAIGGSDDKTLSFGDIHLEGTDKMLIPFGGIALDEKTRKNPFIFSKMMESLRLEAKNNGFEKIRGCFRMKNNLHEALIYSGFKQDGDPILAKNFEGVEGIEGDIGDESFVFLELNLNNNKKI